MAEWPVSEISLSCDIVDATRSLETRCGWLGGICAAVWGCWLVLGAGAEVEVEGVAAGGCWLVLEAGAEVEVEGVAAGCCWLVVGVAEAGLNVGT